MVTGRDGVGVCVERGDERVDVVALVGEQRLGARRAVSDVEGDVGVESRFEALERGAPLLPPAVGQVGVRPVVGEVTGEHGPRVEPPHGSTCDSPGRSSWSVNVMPPRRARSP